MRAVAGLVKVGGQFTQWFLSVHVVGFRNLKLSSLVLVASGKHFYLLGLFTSICLFVCLRSGVSLNLPSSSRDPLSLDPNP